MRCRRVVLHALRQCVEHVEVQPLAQPFVHRHLHGEVRHIRGELREPHRADVAAARGGIDRVYQPRTVQLRRAIEHVGRLHRQRGADLLLNRIVALQRRLVAPGTVWCKESGHQAARQQRRILADRLARRPPGAGVTGWRLAGMSIKATSGANGTRSPIQAAS